MPDLRDVLADAADIPTDANFDAADLLARAARRRRRRQFRLTASVVAVVLVTGVLVTRSLLPDTSVRFAGDGTSGTPRSSGATAPDVEASSAVLNVPPEGQVVAAFLDDGTEVFVVNHDGEVRVMDARRPGVSSFPDSLVGWCPSSRSFEDDLFGSTFDVLGRYTGGPAPTGMAPYASEVVGNRVLVGRRLPAPARSVEPVPPAGPFCFSPSDARADRPLGHHLPSAAAVPVAQALQAPPGTEVVVEARVEIRPKVTRLCPIPTDGAFTRGASNPVELRCPADASTISGIDLGDTPEDPVYVYEGRHVVTRTHDGFADLLIAAGSAAAVGSYRPTEPPASPLPTAASPPSRDASQPLPDPSPGIDSTAEVTDQDRALIEAFRRFAEVPSDATLRALPLAADVRLGLADELVTSRTPAQLADPEAWTLEAETFRAYVGPFSALELLARGEPLEVSVGAHLHCVSPPVPAPGEVAQLRRVSAQPRNVDSCLQWSTVDLFINADGLVEAITLDLYQP